MVVAVPGEPHCVEQRHLLARIAKPLKGFGPSVLEIAVRYRTDAWRVVYVTEVAGRLWVLHAFRKKSKSGVATPKARSI